VFEAFGRGDVAYIAVLPGTRRLGRSHRPSGQPDRRPGRFSVRSTGKTGNSSWVYVWKLRDRKITGYDQFNDPGLAAAFA
jgi:hypothetical protein